MDACPNRCCSQHEDYETKGEKLRSPSLLGCLFFKHMWLFLSLAIMPCIIMIIKSNCWHGFPWPSLAIHPYRPSLQAGLLDYILCLYWAIVCKFLLVGQLWHVHVLGSMGECLLRVRPFFSSSVPLALSILFRLFMRQAVSGRSAAVSWDVTSRVCSI